MRLCASCGEENPDRAKFCLNCAAPLGGTAPRRETRKTVTVIFCDVTGSTDLGERLDPETLRGVMSRYFDAMRSVIETHGGTVEKFIGDAVMAVFGIPRLHEDDALRAVRAAADMQAALAELNERLTAERGVAIAVRTGINTGEVVAGDPSAGQALVTGDAVNVAARLEQAAGPGEILIGIGTYRLVRDAVVVEEVAPLALKGKTEPVPAYLLKSVREGVEGFSRRLDAPLVGRDAERNLLRQAYDRSLREASSHLFTLLGTAGVGKSRLTSEFLRSVADEALVLEGRCLNYGEAITFYPLREAVKQAADIGEEEDVEEVLRKVEKLVLDEEDRVAISQQLAQMMGFVEGAASHDEIYWAVRRVFEALARERPLVVVFDDIHWGEPTFLDLVEHVADWSRDAPILLLCVARPELLDARPGWAGGKLNATSILLEPLSDDEVTELAIHLLGEVDVAPEVRKRIVVAAEGNPLFVEQLLAMFLEEDKIRRSNGSWVPVGDLSEITIPPTIQALIASRLDRLRQEERQVLERASVVGKVFYRGAIAELSPPEEGADLSGVLMSLVRKELIRPDRAEFAGEDGFRFRHILIRDAAYEAMPKQARADLHQRFADWFERLVGERVAEYEEILGYHLEQAYRYARELGPLSDEHVAIGNRASRRLSNAGHRAFTRGDISAASKLLKRAIAVTSNPVMRAYLQLDLVEVEVETGDMVAATALLAEVASSEVEEPSVRYRREVLSAFVDLQIDPEGRVNATESRLQNLVAELEEMGDHRTLAKAYRVLALIANLRCDAAALEQSSQRGLDHARAAGDVWEESEALPWLAVSHDFGQVPLSACLVRFKQLLDEARGQPKLTALARHGVGSCLVRLGQVEEGMKLVYQTRESLRDMGMTMWWGGMSMSVGWSCLATGDLDEAERVLREGDATLETVGEKSYRSTVASTLAEVLYQQDRFDEAFASAALALELGANEDRATSVQARCVQAKVLAHKGDFERAEELIDEAMQIGAPSDFMMIRADPLVDVAEVALLAGRHNEAAEHLRRALALYRSKEDALAVARVEKKLAELSDEDS